MALTEELTFQLGSSGVVLNSDTASLPFVDITSVKGLDSAPFRQTERDWEGNDGTFMDAQFEKGRTVVLEGTVYADSSTIESYLDQLKANYAPSPDLQQFFFKAPGVTERFLFVKSLGCRYDWDIVRRTGQAEVQFMMFAEDPRIYDNTLLNYPVALGSQIYTGFGFSFGFNFGFGGVSSTADGVYVNNTGNRPTPPVFVIEGPVYNPRILNDTTGDEMIFTGITLAVGETLTVDAKYRTVKLNGSVNRRNTLTQPHWFFLEPGQNFIRYRAESALSSTLNIYYYPAYR